MLHRELGEDGGRGSCRMTSRSIKARKPHTPLPSLLETAAFPGRSDVRLSRPGRGRTVLNLLCWTEYVPASVTEGFTKQSGVRVVIENYNSNEQMLAMLHAKAGHYDLVQPSQAYVETLIRADGLEPLDAARIPNLRHLDPQFRGLPHDPELKYSVPWMSGTVGIVVNTEIVKEPIRTWADVRQTSRAHRGGERPARNGRVGARLARPADHADRQRRAGKDRARAAAMAAANRRLDRTARTPRCSMAARISASSGAAKRRCFGKRITSSDTCCRRKVRTSFSIAWPSPTGRRTRAPPRISSTCSPRSRGEHFDQQRISLHESESRCAKAPLA